jgi:hypothetical protein
VAETKRVSGRKKKVREGSKPRIKKDGKLRGGKEEKLWALVIKGTPKSC